MSVLDGLTAYAPRMLAYGGILAVILFSPDLLFLDYLQLRVSILDYDLSALIAWVFGVILGSVLFKVMRMVNGTNTGGGFMSSMFRGGA